MTAVFASVFVASPAFAATEEKINYEQLYSTAGQPPNYVAMAIVMVILLAIVLLGATWIGNMFEKE